VRQHLDCVARLKLSEIITIRCAEVAVHLLWSLLT